MYRSYFILFSLSLSIFFTSASAHNVTPASLRRSVAHKKRLEVDVKRLDARGLLGLGEFVESMIQSKPIDAAPTQVTEMSFPTLAKAQMVCSTGSSMGNQRSSLLAHRHHHRARLPATLPSQHHHHLYLPTRSIRLKTAACLVWGVSETHQPHRHLRLPVRLNHPRALRPRIVVCLVWAVLETHRPHLAPRLLLRPVVNLQPRVRHLPAPRRKTVVCSVLVALEILRRRRLHLVLQAQ
jgi:hypothetical protein